MTLPGTRTNLFSVRSKSQASLPLKVSHICTKVAKLDFRYFVIFFKLQAFAECILLVYLVQVPVYKWPVPFKSTE